MASFDQLSKTVEPLDITVESYIRDNLVIEHATDKEAYDYWAEYYRDNYGESFMDSIHWGDPMSERLDAMVEWTTVESARKNEDLRNNTAKYMKEDLITYLERAKDPNTDSDMVEYYIGYAKGLEKLLKSDTDIGGQDIPIDIEPLKKGNKEKLKEYGNLSNVKVPSTANDTLYIQTVLQSFKESLIGENLSKDEINLLEKDLTDAIATHQGNEYLKLFYTMKDSLYGDSYLDRTLSVEGAEQKQLLGMKYTSVEDGSEFESYAEGLRYDMALVGDKKDKLKLAKDTFLKKNPNYAEYLAGYNRLHSRLQDQHKTGGSYHTYMYSAHGHQATVDSYDPTYILGQYGYIDYRYKSTGHTGFSPIDRWNIYDPEYNDPNYQYIMSDTAFVKAYEAYSNLVWEERSFLGGMFGDYAGTDDDLFNTGTYTQRLAKVTEKYKGYGSKRTIIIDAWKKANQEFTRVYDQLKADKMIVNQYRSKYTQTGKDVSTLLQITIGLTGGSVGMGASDLPTYGKAPSNPLNEAALYESFLTQEQELDLQHMELQENFNFITGN